MKGVVVCLCMIFLSLGLLAWMSWKNQEKYRQNAVKIFLVTAVLGLMLCITQLQNQKLTKQGTIQRNPAGQGELSQTLQLTVPGILEDYDYQLDVKEKRLQGKKLRQVLEDAAGEAEQVFLNKNTSLDEIQSDVALPKSLQEGKIKAQWTFEPDNVFDEEGHLDSSEVSPSGTLVMVSLTLSYFDLKKNESFGCLVFPKKVNPKDQILSALDTYFQKEEDHPEEVLQLPEKISGYRLQWEQKPDQSYKLLLLLGIVAAALLCAEEKQKEIKQSKKRKECLLRDYPDMVSKLTLLLGAGMTLTGAWEKIVLNYQKKRRKGLVEELPVYEEMLYSYREIQDGVGELKVYERFGDRCGIRPYRKLVALIIQNLRKGSAGLTKLLEKEVTEAFELRKNNAKRIGEQAGTKLLFPMMLMLCVVMVIILVPAVMSFRMV